MRNLFFSRLATNDRAHLLPSLRRLALLPALLGLVGRAPAQTTPAWQSAVVPLPVAGSGTTQIQATAVDKTTGAVFVTGSFTGQASFGGTTLTSMGRNDMFVARYDPATATWAWAKSGGGAVTDIGYGITADGQGGVYVTGSFSSDNSGSTFAGQPALYSTRDEMFVAAYAAADGTGRWAKSGGGTGDDQGNGIAADGQGGVYVTGTFSGTSGGTFAGQPALSGIGSEAFVAAYAAADGAGRWAKSGGGINADEGLSIAADGLGGVYVTGAFTSVATFAGQPTMSGLRQEVFVAAYAAADGTGRWAKSGGSPGDDLGYGIVTDGQGGVYVTGQFVSNGSFGGQPVVRGTGATEAFVAAYAAADGAGRWAKSGGGPDNDSGNSIAVDGQGGVYVTGYFTTSGTFAGQPTLTGTGQEAFVAAYASADGTGRWAKSGGGAVSDIGTGVATDGTRLYMGGQVGLPARFDAIALPGTTNPAGVLAGLTIPAVPYLAAIGPASGPVGTSVTLTGSNLTGATAVTFSGTTNNTVSTGLIVSGSGSTQTLTVAVPAGAATGPVTVTGPNGPSNGVAFTVIGPLTVSGGTLAAPVVVAAGTYTTLTITSTGVARLGGAVAATTAVVVNGTLLTACQPLTGAGSFTLNAEATLGICDAAGLSLTSSTGAVQVSGPRSFAPNAIYLYNGTVAQATGTGLPATVRELALSNAAGLTLSQPVQITQRVLLTSGDLTLNGQALTLLSDANGTALVANVGGLVLGATATMQRHIETNTAANGYRHYASPMAPVAGAETLGATLATTGYTPDFRGAATYNSSATPGTVTPFPTVFLYNQDRIAGLNSTYDTFDKGWQAALGTELPQVGRGYTVQAPGAVLVDFTGTLVSGSASRSNLQRASADPATGWHLLGNPFPSPLDWSTMSVGTTNTANLQNMDGALYVFQSSGPYAGSYRTYLAAAPGADSPIVPAGAGFFVHTTSAATPGIVRFNPENRVTTFGPQPAFGRNAADARPRLTLALASPAGPTDALTVYADPAATPGFDAAFDAQKLANPTGLNLLARAGADNLAIDALPAFAAGTVVPLAVGVPAAGTYALQVRELASLPVGFTATLVDTQLNTRTELATLPAAGYAFSVTAAQATTLLTGRFYLSVVAASPLATAAGRAATTLSLYPNPAHGAATLTGAQPGSAVVVLDALGRAVVTATADAAGTAALALPAALPAGVYVVRAGATALRLVRE